MINRVSRRIASIRRRGALSENDLLKREGLLTIGRHTYAGGFKVHSWRAADGRWMCDRVTIGSFCSIAWDVEFFPGGMHPIQHVTTFPLRSRWDLPGRDALT